MKSTTETQRRALLCVSVVLFIGLSVVG